MCFKRICFSVFIYFVTCSLAFFAQAEDISAKKSCAELKVLKQTFVKSGVVKNMKKGPDWVQKNLDEKALQVVKDFINVSEQLIFRCGSKTFLVRNDVYGRKKADGEIEDGVSNERYRKVPLPTRRPNIKLTLPKKVKKTHVSSNEFFSSE